MKKLSDDDILKWLKSDEKSHLVYKEKLIAKKDFPKPNQITRDTLRKILKGRIKIDAESIILNVTKCSAPNKTKRLCII